MLPDFPDIKSKIADVLLHRLKGLVSDDPLIKSVPVQTLKEGNRLIVRREDGTEDTTEFHEVKAESSISCNDIVVMGPYAFVKNQPDVAKQMQEQQTTMFFSEIDKVTRKVGNVVNGGGQTFSFELFLKGLEKVQIDFRPDGSPILPNFHVGPELAEAIKKLLPKWEENAEYSKAFNALIERQREQYLDRESSRKLVD